MCTRYMIVSSASRLAKALGLKAIDLLRPRYNAAPTQSLPVVRRESGGLAREAVAMRWGLVPAWSREPQTPTLLLNARAETAARKPAFRDAYRRRRCLVPADGFYEWQKTPGGRWPWLFQRADEQPFCFAGLWDHWEREGAPAFDSFAILTTTPNSLVASLHNRMPVILAPEAEDTWLATDAAPADLERLCTPFPVDAMKRRAVNPRLNHVAFDDPACLDPPPATGGTSATQQLDLGI